MNSSSVVPNEALSRDLQLAVAYASRAGLLSDDSVLTDLKNAEDALANGEQPDTKAVSSALNKIARIIAPITVADLVVGRDPFAARNQRRSRMLQFCLTVFALAVLLLIGYFLHSLRIEKAAIVTLEEIQELRPQQKLIALRKMAQFEKPLQIPNTLHDQYHQKLAELMSINSKLYSIYTDAVNAAAIPLFPFGPSPGIISSGPSVPVAVAVSPTASDTAAGQASNGSPTAPADTMTPGVLGVAESADVCVEEENGNIKLPKEAARYPEWMKVILTDALSDFCFQLKILGSGGTGALLNQSLGQLSFVSDIKEKVSLRADWFLPFLFGLLGATIYMMRNVASVRTAAVEWFPVVMRVSLGGVAGIVVGWFSASSASFQMPTASALTLPFALAFLIGYGIDALFTLLDKLNRLIGETAGARG